MRIDRLALRVQTAPTVRLMTIVAVGPQTDKDGTVVLSNQCFSAVEVIEEADRMIRDLERIKRAAADAARRALDDSANYALPPQERLV